MKLHGLTPVVSSKSASQAKLVFAVCSPANGGVARKHSSTALRSWFSALLIKSSHVSAAINNSKPSATDKQINAASLKNKNSTVKYVVKNGDSLWKISRDFYGKGTLWTKIISSNKSTTIYPGDILEIPLVSDTKEVNKISLK